MSDMVTDTSRISRAVWNLLPSTLPCYHTVENDSQMNGPYRTALGGLTVDTGSPVAGLSRAAPGDCSVENGCSVVTIPSRMAVLA